MSRQEAAARAIAEQDRRRLSSFHQAQARDALAAADAVMFSDEAMERAAVALYNLEFPCSLITDLSELLEWRREQLLHQASIVVAALKGEQ
ncbi:hypothetical protein [Arthrobacter sp. YN]|uniref:hypothetical protein n=1 Tax=Arthrobacter sp. YN TaxID=2020486 RepID=UPI0012FD68EE|nr:hypothetical protein [Arthrobacter sp. YN]